MTPLRGRGLVVLSTALCCLLILLAPAVRIIQDPAGLWLIIGAPTCVYYGTARRVVSTPDGAALLAFGFTILHDLLVLLGLDLVLPLFGDKHPLQLAPITLALGTNSCSSSRFFDPSRVNMGAMPVTLPSGRLMLDTSPAPIGSLPLRKTMGIV